MGHGKETPRQKMIGMMYLVLMAMLALNVSKDVLNAFAVLDDGLVSTIGTLEATNSKILDDFNFQKDLNATKVGPFLITANIVKQKADSIYHYIQDLKLKLVHKAEGEDTKAIHDGKIDITLIGAKDNADIPAEVMIGDNNDKEARNIREKIDAYRHFLLEEVILNKNDSAIRASIESSLSTKGGNSTHGGNGSSSWERDHFEHLPLGGVLAIMSGIQINIKNAEAEVLRYLYNQIDAGDIKFNRTDATIIPNSNYVIKGTEFKAHVFLSATDTTAKPRILVTEGNVFYDSTEIAKGIYSYLPLKNINYDEL